MLYLTLDIGTTTIKGVAYNEAGTVQAQHEETTTTYVPQSGYSEKDPDEVVAAAILVLKELCAHAKKVGEEIEFLSCSAFMHSILAVDEGGKPLTPCLLWNDGRSVDYAEQYQKNGKGMRIYRHTGTPIHPMSPLYKLMWMRDSESEIFTKAYKFISIKEYLFHFMIGQYVVDQSIASATGMFNFLKLQWSQFALDEIGITVDKLSTVVETTATFTDLRQDFLQAIDYDNTFTLVAGASDGCLANLGSRGFKPHTGVVTMGTSGAVRVVTEEPIIDEQGRTFTYILWKNRYVSGGAINNGGITFEWFRDLFEDDIDIDEALATTIQEERGLLFLPFLTGERAPYWNARLRGAYLGAEVCHTKKDFLAATIEGTCFAIKSVFEILSSYTPHVDIIYANGGFTKSEIWLKTMSAILGKPIEIFDQGDGACFGAYLLGMKAIGKIADEDELETFFAEGKRFDELLTDHYIKLFEVYKQAVKKNADILANLASLQKKGSVE